MSLTICHRMYTQTRCGITATNVFYYIIISKHIKPLPFDRILLRTSSASTALCTGLLTIVLARTNRLSQS